MSSLFCSSPPPSFCVPSYLYIEIVKRTAPCTHMQFNIAVNLTWCRPSLHVSLLSSSLMRLCIYSVYLYMLLTLVTSFWSSFHVCVFVHCLTSQGWSQRSFVCTHSNSSKLSTGATQTMSCTGTLISTLVYHSNPPNPTHLIKLTAPMLMSIISTTDYHS